MTSIRVLAGATYGLITRHPLYHILLAVAGVFILLSKFMTHYQFNMEINLVREMGIATIMLWALLVDLFLPLIVVTRELEDRTAVTLLSKPIRRREFLLGRFLGLVLSLIPGVLFLGGILFLTLLWMSSARLPINDVIIAEGLKNGVGPFMTTWSITWNSFVAPQGGVVLQGSIFSFLMGVILAAISVSFSAFFPMIVSVGATTLLFLLGNVTTYMLASVERMKVAPLAGVMEAVSYVLPNFGYFNLQNAFNEGRIASLAYMGLVSLYTVLYVSAVFFVSCSVFRTREVR